MPLSVNENMNLNGDLPEFKAIYTSIYA